MKKTIIILSVLFCCLSCSKKEATVSPLTTNIPSTNSNARGEAPTLTGGRWIFSSEQHFEDYIKYLDGIDVDQWEADNQFVSYRTNYLSGLSESEIENLTEMPIDDASLATVLNTNGIVQVTPWIFKLNPSNRIVYALHTNYISDIAQLNSAIPVGEHIREFSFDDEVFEMIEELPMGKNNAQCATRIHTGTGPLFNGKFINYCNNFKYSVYLRYDNWGIIKKIYSEFKHRHIGSGGNIDYTNFAVDWDYNWTQKNGNSETSNNAVVFVQNGQQQIPVYSFLDKNWCKTFYHGTKCLQNFKTNVKVYFIDACQQNANIYITTEKFTI